MKKILIATMLILISLIIPYNVYALSTTEAREEIDVDKNCNLTINYYYDDYDFSNTNVKIYHIADVSSDFQYQLSSEFTSYPIKINGIKTNDEWNILEKTLDSYIIADNIMAFNSYELDGNTLNIPNLKPGLYYIKTEQIDTDDYTLTFDSFLISLPELIETGTWNYNVEVYPKAEEYIPKYDEITYTVTKTWKDDQNKRPKSIDVEIYEDGKLIEKQVLSSKNNWTYQWVTDDDGSIWTVVERNIPTGYDVSIKNQDKNFLIINTDPNYREENPITLDNINIYIYLLIGSIIGFVLLLITFIINKKKA